MLLISFDRDLFFFEDRFVTSEGLQMSLTKFIDQETNALFEVVGECSFQSASVVVEESPEAFPPALPPFSLEDGLDGPSLLALEPIVASQAPRCILLPLSLVPLHCGEPVHHTSALLLVVPPFSLIFVSRLIFHLSMAISQASFEFSLEDCPVGETKHSPAFLHSLAPLSLVCGAIDGAIVLSVAMSTSLYNASRVVTSIGPPQLALSSYGIVADLSVIEQSVLPPVQSLPVHEAIPEPACV